jgi:hypothetical protein
LPADDHGRARAAARTRPGTAAARRVSGPVARAQRGGGAAAVALPAPARARTGAFERLRGVPDSRLLGRLLRSRAWIWMVGLALGGIVAMQVSLLKLNTGISRAVTSAATLERQNAALEAGNTRLLQVARIRTVAAAGGMVTPAAGDIAFVTVRGPLDVRRALKRMQGPSAEAEAIMANGGRAPATATADAAVAGAGTTAATTAAAPATTSAPAPAAATATGTGGVTATQAPDAGGTGTAPVAPAASAAGGGVQAASVEPVGAGAPPARTGAAAATTGGATAPGP